MTDQVLWTIAIVYNQNSGLTTFDQKGLPDKANFSKRVTRLFHSIELLGIKFLISSYVKS